MGRDVVSPSLGRGYWAVKAQRESGDTGSAVRRQRIGEGELKSGIIAMPEVRLQISVYGVHILDRETRIPVCDDYVLG